MELLIATPAPRNAATGNRIHALRWARWLRGFGHRVTVADATTSPLPGFGRYDALLALHARKSARWIECFRRHHATRPIAVCLTGTDLHVDLRRAGSDECREAQMALELANWIVLLEPRGRQLLDSRLARRTIVIPQSARALKQMPAKSRHEFVITVVANLRSIKDPLRAALAARLLHADSRVVVELVGEVLDEELAETARELGRNNDRFRWTGPLPYAAARRRLAASHGTVVSSIAEGASTVAAEAVADGVPVLATRIDGVIAILGQHWPALFEPGDTRELARLIGLLERDLAFQQQMSAALTARRPYVHPRRERNQLKRLVDRLSDGGQT